MDSTSEPPSSQPQASTKMATSTLQPAAHAVFNTNELLCGIIVRLPFEDIITATGVCQAWRKALKGNVAIQKAIFLAPVDVSDIMSEVDCLGMNLEDIPRDENTIAGKHHRHLPITLTTRAVPPYGAVSISKGPVGVWADMFVTQPPVKEVTVRIHKSYAETPPGRTEDGRVSFKCETGVKMGELHKFCRSLLQPHSTATTLVIILDSFDDGNSYVLRGRGRWGVRDGKVCRQTQPRLIEMSDDSSEEYGGYRDEERYNGYYSDGYNDNDEYDEWDPDGNDDDHYGGEY